MFGVNSNPRIRDLDRIWTRIDWIFEVGVVEFIFRIRTFKSKLMDGLWWFGDLASACDA